MAEFLPAYTKTMQHEGKYVDHPSDPGGETYKGIARKYHPDWDGWPLIDAYKSAKEFPHVLDRDHGLQQLTRTFYKNAYWDKFQGDNIPSQEIAECVFDTAVHMGIGRAVKYLQTALNVFNRRGTLWPDVLIDSTMGPKTLAALDKYYRIEGPGYIIKAIQIQRGAHYIQRALDHEGSEEFIRGWFRRLRI